LTAVSYIKGKNTNGHGVAKMQLDIFDTHGSTKIKITHKHVLQKKKNTYMPV
jgi:hypothetical protein